MNQLRILARILGPKRNLDHRSFSSLGRGYVNEFIQIISFFEQWSFKLRCETDGVVLCYIHQACCLLYNLCEITSNKGIHIYLSGCNCAFGFGEKKARIADLHTPIHPPHYLSPYRPYLHKDRYTIFAVLRPSVARPTLKIFKLIGVSSLSIEIDLMKLKMKR